MFMSVNLVLLLVVILIGLGYISSLNKQICECGWNNRGNQKQRTGTGSEP